MLLKKGYFIAAAENKSECQTLRINNAAAIFPSNTLSLFLSDDQKC